MWQPLSMMQVWATRVLQSPVRVQFLQRWSRYMYGSGSEKTAPSRVIETWTVLTAAPVWTMSGISQRMMVDETYVAFIS